MVGPIVALWLAAAGFRLLEHWVLDAPAQAGELTVVGKLVIELLGTASQVLIVAAGFGTGLYLASRLLP